jgi:hypothetical protein
VVAYPKADMNVPLRDRFANVREEFQIKNMTLADIQVDGHQGLDASYERVREGIKYSCRHRIFYANGALYQLTATTDKGHMDDSDIEDFFSSFHFLPDPAPHK